MALSDAEQLVLARDQVRAKESDLYRLQRDLTDDRKAALTADRDFWAKEVARLEKKVG